MFSESGPLASIFSFFGPHVTSLLVLFSILDFAPQLTFLMASWLLQKESPHREAIISDFHIQNHGNPVILLSKRWRRIFEDHWVKSIFSWNQQWHWSLEIVGHSMCRRFYTEFSRKGTSEPGRIWCRHFSSILKCFQDVCGEIHGHISWQFWDE